CLPRFAIAPGGGNSGASHPPRNQDRKAVRDVTRSCRQEDASMNLRRLGWAALLGLSVLPGRSFLAGEPARLGLPSATPIPATAPTDPQQLANTIAAQLKHSGTLKHYTVDITVRAGTVELTGRVADQTQREEVLRLVQGVPGVVRVSDRLTLAQPS